MNRIRFDELLDAFEVASFGQPGESEAYLRKDDGTFHCHSEYGDADPLPDGIDSEKYIQIPHKNALDLGRNLAVRFGSEVMPGDLRTIEEIFSRTGAFARFKGLLESRGLLQRWYDYEDQAKKDAIRAWCAENAIEIDD